MHDLELNQSSDRRVAVLLLVHAQVAYDLQALGQGDFVQVIYQSKNILAPNQVWQLLFQYFYKSIAQHQSLHDQQLAKHAAKGFCCPRPPLCRKQKQ